MTSQPKAPNAVDEVVDIRQSSHPIRHDQHRRTGDDKGGGGGAKWVAQILEEVGYTTKGVRPVGSGHVSPRLAGPPDSTVAHCSCILIPIGAGRTRRLERAPVLRIGVRRIHLGPWRRRHEGHGRHGSGAGPPIPARRHPFHRGANGSPSSPTRRRAARGARTGWSRTVPTCSRASPRRWA